MIIDVRDRNDTLDIIKDKYDTLGGNTIVAIVDDIEFLRLQKELDDNGELWGFYFTQNKIQIEAGSLDDICILKSSVWYPAKNFHRRGDNSQIVYIIQDREMEIID